MTIQRQYSLPNCKLILQGLSDAENPNLGQGQVLSILTNAECHIQGQEQSLTGGRDFFESLVRQVSSYAQEFLSGISLPRHQSESQELVHLQKIDTNLHRLTVSEGNVEDRKPGIILDLNTVQLFDLVEAVDQFFADSLTLPGFSLAVKPVSRKEAKSGEPVVQKVIPAAVGMSGLALASLALFFVPIPEVQRPKDPQPQSNESIDNLEASPNSTSEPGFNPTPTPEGLDSSPDATVNSSDEVDGVDTSEQTLTEENSETSLTSSEITDEAEIQRLKNLLYEKINNAWTTEINEALTYRVTVASDGSIIGYKPISPADANGADKTPLPDLQDEKASGEENNQSIVEFKVLFQENGTLEIEPL